MNCNFFLLNVFVAKTYLLKVLHGAFFRWTLWVFLLGLPNLKLTLVTLNTSFHKDLGRFVGDLTCIIQILK
jgi:hypothetical protein